MVSAPGDAQRMMDISALTDRFSDTGLCKVSKDPHSTRIQPIQQPTHLDDGISASSHMYRALSDPLPGQADIAATCDRPSVIPQTPFGNTSANVDWSCRTNIAVQYTITHAIRLPPMGDAHIENAASNDERHGQGCLCSRRRKFTSSVCPLMRKTLPILTAEPHGYYTQQASSSKELLRRLHKRDAIGFV